MKVNEVTWVHFKDAAFHLMFSEGNGLKSPSPFVHHFRDWMYWVPFHIQKQHL